MPTDNVVLRAILWYLWKKNFTAGAATTEICTVLGESVLHRNTAIKWFKRFNEGATELDDLSRSGRPRADIDDALVASVKEQPHASTRVLSSQVGVSHVTVSKHLKDLGCLYIKPRQDPHELTEAQAQRRLLICKQLLENPNDDRFWKTIVTSDEKWIFYKNPDLTKQWLLPGTSAKSVAKQDPYGKKVMLCVWWNYEGVVHFELLHEGVTVNSTIYKEQLTRVYDVLKEKYPHLVNRGNVRLQHDNAPAHRSKTTTKKIESMEGVQVLPHPAYSPDLAPSDYGLFRSMATFLRGRQFANYDDVKKGCQDFFDSQEKTWYRSKIRQLAERWAKVVEHDGLYFEA